MTCSSNRKGLYFQVKWLWSENRLGAGGLDLPAQMGDLNPVLFSQDFNLNDLLKDQNSPRDET